MTLPAAPIARLHALALALLFATGSAHAYRDLETGTFLSRDPAGFVDGPNLYAYVNQNPWTFFDPLGLEATVTQRKDEENPEVTVTKIEITAAIVDNTTKGVTKEEMKEIRNSFKDGIESQYRTENLSPEDQKKHRIEVSVTISIDKTAKEIQEENLHVIKLNDSNKPPPNSKDSPAYVNYNGGMEMNVSMEMHESTSNPQSWGRHSGHESGHWLGLRHPFPTTDPTGVQKMRNGWTPENKKGRDPLNPINLTDPSRNFMGYEGYRQIEGVQLDEAKRNYDSNNLNRRIRPSDPKIKPRVHP